jgi:hypothetical protein
MIDFRNANQTSISAQMMMLYSLLLLLLTSSDIPKEKIFVDTALETVTESQNLFFV